MKRLRPRTEESYGIPQEENGQLAWDFVTTRIAEARHYWISTTGPGQRPHAMPTWGVWVNDAFYFGGGRETRKAKNIAANPQVVIHSESGEDVFILEGRAEEVLDPAAHIMIDDAYEAKYGIRHGTPVWRLVIEKAFAWQMATYPASATKWVAD